MSNEALKRKYQDIENNYSPEDCTLMGITNCKGDIIFKVDGRSHFPWDEVKENKFSRRYILDLLEEMTPFATAETEDFIVIFYSPTKVIGGSDIAKMLNASHQNNISISESDASSSFTASPSPPRRTSTGARVFSTLKKWMRLE